MLSHKRKISLVSAVIALAMCLVASGIVYAITAHQLSKSVPATVNIKAPSALNGDANWDGIVDSTDLAMVASAFNTSPPSIPSTDFNNDNIVNIWDLAIVGVNYGKSVNK